MVYMHRVDVFTWTPLLGNIWPGLSSVTLTQLWLGRQGATIPTGMTNFNLQFFLKFVPLSGPPSVQYTLQCFVGGTGQRVLPILGGRKCQDLWAKL